ncbi:MAG TPA: efflux RND transporter periplasmic adaptor subunit, partial [Steroidobacteraceae bacterium]|nr:efflux RND transporter periplasmic adaptor subunit [Steroidobacteraceae bacterium]
MLLSIGAALVYWRTSPHIPSTDLQPASSTDRNVLYWHDPMVPHARFDKPGKSPFMDMQLVPVYADEAGAAGTVRVDPNVAQNLGIRIGKVERIRLQPQLTAVGSVAFDDRLLQVVPARVDGVVLQLHVRAPLEPVRRGQPLATVLVPEWTGAQQEYLALLDARSDAARSLLGAARERLRLLGVPDATVGRIESDRKVEATTTITSPADGVVSELGVREGSTFTTGAALFRINGLASVWVNARIPEAQVSHVQVGATVTADATAWPGEVLSGKVIALLPEVDATTRTMTARLAFDNRGGRLAPGMFVSVTLVVPSSGEVLVLPSEAVIMTGTRTVVVTVNADRTFGIADVRPG